jgi:predicted ATP-grasp superfamily ATP-dependent carboligase
MSLLPADLLLVGVSTRAMAESAARAGCRVSAVDAFGDLDQKAIARVISVERDGGAPYSAERAVRLAEAMSADAVTYVSNLENHASLVARLARRFRLLGNEPRALELARDPLHLMRVLRREGMAFAKVRLSSPSISKPSTNARADAWLRKPKSSGGGRGIRPWKQGESLPRSAYLQERITGVTGSIVFAAEGGYAVPFGFSRQLVGERAFGAGGFKYCGSLLGHPARLGLRGDALLARAAAVANFLTAACGLKGVNCIDFSIRRGTLYPLEVNPRPSASMELAERALGVSVFRLHAEALSGRVAEYPLEQTLKGAGVTGKAILHARGALIMGDTRAWLDDENIRDVPHRGERIATGQPVCTIFATGRDAEACKAALIRRAERVYRSMQRS